MRAGQLLAAGGRVGGQGAAHLGRRVQAAQLERVLAHGRVARGEAEQQLTDVDLLRGLRRFRRPRGEVLPAPGLFYAPVPGLSFLLAFTSATR